jgi:uncharacterized RmlC-like cupin family protein
MERAVAVSASAIGSRNLYSAVVTTPPGGSTRVHHHGGCETAIYVVSGRARFTWGPTGTEDEQFAGTGDIAYVPAHEVHSEHNASDTEPLVVVVTRNCPEAVVHYVDGAAAT